MLIKIHKPWNDGAQKVWFNGQNKIYSMNNTVVVDYWGLFIYLYFRYPCSYHDVMILCQFELHKNWCQCFLHGDEYFEHLLGKFNYLSEKMFIVKKIRRCEIRFNVDQDAIKAYIKMHARYRVWVQCGIGGLKRKWRQLMKRFNPTKPKYT